MKKIVPAILTDNLTDFKIKIKKLASVTDLVQVDIMDGQFVKNNSIALADLKKIKIPVNLEIHLMVKKPAKYLKTCQELNIKRLFFHLEAVKNPLKILKKLKQYAFAKGLALNPETPVKKVKPYMKYLDSVLLLGVRPGFQGQAFNKIVLKKIKDLKKTSKKINIAVDGGIKLSNAKQIIKAGADSLVIGSYLFQSGDLAATFKNLKDAINE
ncbi:MAG: ribulose-phosphate 3-epimerase [Parcubacteria group bacterium]|nr:ribulose-phosphate 3-epimerase [Parcubacteria group bacterium]